MILIDQLISPLERLINEQGSAEMLQKHLEFVKFQLVDYEAKHRRLEAENAQLKADLQQMKNQAQELESKLEEIQTEFHCHCKGI